MNTTYLNLETIAEHLNIKLQIDKKGYLHVPEYNGFKIRKFFKINSEQMDKGHFTIDRYFTDGFIKFQGIKQFHTEEFSTNLHEYNPITIFLKDNQLSNEQYLEANTEYNSILMKIGEWLGEECIPNFMKNANIGDVLDVFGRFQYTKLDSVIAEDKTEYALTSIQYALDVKKKHYSLYRKHLKHPFSYLYCQHIPCQKDNIYHFNLNYGRGDYQYNYCLDNYKNKINASDKEYLLTLPYKASDILRDLMLVIAGTPLSRYSNTDGEELNDWYYFYDTDINNEIYNLKFPYLYLTEIKELEFIMEYKLNEQKKSISIPFELIALKQKENILELLISG